MVLFAKSKRLISAAKAKEIIAVLPPYVTPVGLFVDLDAEAIRKMAEALGLSVVQLHGAETPRTVAALKPLSVIKAVGVEAIGRWRRATPDNLIGLLLDSPVGGSGVVNDWKAIRERKRLLSGRHWIAAGGLTPENVGEVVRTLRPWGVDVSSGVESGPGTKSAELIAAFIRAVRAADAAG